MSTENEFIKEFLDSETINSLKFFLDKNEGFESSADVIAKAFGFEENFSKINDSDVQKLVVSFKNNLKLLIQKTWVEKSDIALKEQLLYKLESFLSDENPSWEQNYVLFRSIIDQAVFLMFGQPTNSPEFEVYTLRIDPEFGIFWWYISSLPNETSWSEKKCKIAMLLGMYFLANY